MTSWLLTSSIRLPQPVEELFPFFAEARNLEQITPPWLRFSVLTPEPITMAVGTTIDYRLRWHGLPLSWRSEIAAWEPPRFFVDRQLRGPYRLWHHEHHFTPMDGGTVVEDRVRYAVPLGRLVQRMGVGRDVESIFAYRHQRLAEIFSGCENHGTDIDTVILPTS